MKNLRLMCTLFCCGIFQTLSCVEYLYPVAASCQPDSLKIYVIHQRSLEHLELWLWDPATTIGTRLLLSTYSPAGLQLLPSGNGFSFVDNGRIRVKNFIKRSPKTVALDEPIYDVSLIHWINDHSYYFSAKLAERFGIFYGTDDGSITKICSHETCDYMYPQKIQDTLFSIQRIHDKQSFYHSIVKIDCSVQSGEKKISTLYGHGSNPLIFLNMISEHEGFFVEHPSLVYSHHSVLPCSCYHFYCNNGEWEAKKIFEFSLPTSLLFSQHQDTVLHETLLRLVPQYHDDKIFFCDCNDITTVRRKAANLDLYYYDMELDTKHKISHAHHGQFFFAPLPVNNVVYYGGQLSEQEESLPTMWLNEQGDVCFKLPSISAQNTDFSD